MKKTNAKTKAKPAGLGTVLKDRKNAFIVTALLLVVSVLLIYIGAGRVEINKLTDEKNNALNALSDIESALTEVTTEKSETEQAKNIILDEFERLSSENIEQREELDNQSQIIAEQQEIINSQNQTIISQQETIDRTDEALSEIADIIGTDIDPLSGDSMANGITEIESTKEILVNTFNNHPNIDQYIGILDQKKADITEKLKYYPDYNPADGKISYTFGNHYVTKNGKTTTSFHRGLDIFKKEGGAIYAAAAGTVTEVHLKDDGTGLGYYVRINHGNGYMTLYGHISSACVKVGQVVEKGEKIAMMGKTGAATGVHLHFEVYLHGQLQDPLNYVDY